MKLPLASLVFIVGCSDCAGKAVPVATETAYTAELLRCVDKATTLAESKACRAHVDEVFGVKDGGVDQ